MEKKDEVPDNIDEVNIIVIVADSVLPDSFRGMGARRNSVETQKSYHTPIDQKWKR